LTFFVTFSIGRRPVVTKRELFGEIGQWVSAAMVTAAAVVEYITKADVFYLIITCGAIVWGVTQKVKHPRRYHEEG